MLKLSSSLFQDFCLYNSPEQTFALKRVCKQLNKECSNETLWKKLTVQNHPSIISTCDGNFQEFMRSLTKPLNIDVPILEFVFELTTPEGDRVCFRWKSDKDFPSLAGSGILVAVKALRDQYPDLEQRDITDICYVAKLYIIKYGDSKKIQCVILNEIDTDEDGATFERLLDDDTITFTAINAQFWEEDDGSWKSRLQLRHEEFSSDWDSSTRSKNFFNDCAAIIQFG